VTRDKSDHSHPLSEVIYEGVLETPPWHSLLKRLEDYLSTKSASLVIRRPSDHGPGSTITLYENLEAMRDFETSRYKDSPFAELPEDQVFCLSDRVTLRELEELDHYKYFMKVYDVTDLMGFDVCDNQSDNHIRLRLRVVRLGSEPKFSESDRQRLASIIPLMKKSLTIYSRMEIRGISQEIYQQLLASMDIASFILGSNYEVMAKNYLAEQVVKNKDGLFLDNKKLYCTNPLDQQKFTDLCDGLLNARSEDDSVFLLENFSLSRGKADARWSALVRPVNSRGFMGAEANPELLLLVRDASRRQIPSPRLLIDVFGVTPAEARLMLKLIDGLSLTAAAQALGISRNTARTQLSAIFSKTNLNSQTQLVKLVSDTLSNHWL
jgi:DNA-binding CsgD family transcriptional regulator